MAEWVNGAFGWVSEPSEDVSFIKKGNGIQYTLTQQNAVSTV